MRSKIFISHSNPDDNDQARWLGIQLMTLGYDVWCDVFNLKGGEKFWTEIEAEIRTSAAKFLYILTSNSNHKEGCLNELSVAEATEKGIPDKRFIVALHFDPHLTHDSVNINLKRKISIDFKSDWRQGLKDLLRAFEEEPKPIRKESPDFEFIQNYWKTIYLNDRRPIAREEFYVSNWFPLIALPTVISIHNFGGMIPKGFDWSSLKFPTRGFKRHTVTFGSCFDFTEQMPLTSAYDPSRSRHYNVFDVLQNGHEDRFISNKVLRNMISNLISQGFVNTLVHRGLVPYPMSKSIALCFNTDVNDNRKFSFGQLVGKLKERTWHFALSGFPDFEHNVFVLKTHIIFSEEGDFIKSKRVQQSGRRKQGRNWWNRHWKQKLLSAVDYLAEDSDTFKIEVGANENIVVACSPWSFTSELSYIDPGEARESNDDFNDDDSIDEDDTNEGSDK
jgi:hypothetical protein